MDQSYDLEDDYVDFKTASRLSEMGFPQCAGEVRYAVKDCYDASDYPSLHKAGERIYADWGFSADEVICCPTVWAARKWLETRMHMTVVPEPFLNGTKLNGMWTFRVYDGFELVDKVPQRYGDMPSAVEAGVNYAMRLLDNKNEKA